MTKKLIHKTFIVLFVMLLVTPNIVLLLNLEKEVLNNENSTSETVPKFQISNPISTFNKYKNYYLSNYGLKKTLINQYINFKKNILRENPLPHSVIEGKNNWHFLGNAYNNVFTNTFNNNHDINNITEVTKQLKSLSDYLKKENILFYLVVAPNKHTVYKQHLPYKLSQNKTFYDLLKDELNKVNINYIDLHKTLLNKEERTYYKTDTHWNKRGAFYSYKEIIKTLSNDLNSNDLLFDNYQIIQSTKQNNDLLKMINVYTNENTVDFLKIEENKIDTLSKKHDNLVFSNPAKDFKLLMTRDSFSNAWISFFNESFRQTKYLTFNHKITPQLINQYKPDVVIIEIVERNLTNLTKPIFSQTTTHLKNLQQP